AGREARNSRRRKRPAPDPRSSRPDPARSPGSGSEPPGRPALVDRTRGANRHGADQPPRAQPRQEQTMAQHSQTTRRPPTLELAAALAPNAAIADKIANSFGFDSVDYDHIREESTLAVQAMADSFGGALNDKATAMHFQRIVQALVGSAIGAGQFYSQK